jgi:hypothetical protein
MTTQRLIHRITTGTVLAFGVWAAAQDQGGARPATAPASGPAASQPTEGPSPRMELSSTQFDFGEVWQSQPVKRDFSIKNGGDADLTIAVKSSCGCTVATSPKSPLPPGESSTFAITYDTKRLGEANKKVTLSTNDPGQPNVDIAVIGTVKPVFAMSPTDRIMLQNLEPNAAERGTLKLVSQYGQPLPLKLKDGQDFGRFEITLKELKPGQEYELVAVTRPPLNIGWNQVDVALDAGAPDVPTITIPVSANVQPRVIAFPPMFSVNPETKEPTQKVVSVDYRKDTPIKIAAVQPTIAGIKYELLPDEPVPADRKMASHKIRLTIPPYADVPADGAKVEILTDDQDPQYQKLEVRILKLNEVPRIRRILPKTEGEPKPDQSPAQPAVGKP